MNVRPVLVLFTLPLLACARAPEAKSSTSLSSADPPALTEATERLDDAITVMQKVGDKLPTAVAKRARCVAVVPHMIKGGLVIGARQGRGFATCRTASSWSAPAPIRISGASVGAQVGVESVDVVMVVVSDEGRKKLSRSKLALGADASIAAGPVGKGREAATNADDLKAEILSYSLSRGLFVGAELNGAVVEQDDEATRALYGASRPDLRTLLSGDVPVPPKARPFIDAVRDATQRPSASI